MRVAIGTLSHETNTFTTDRTTLADFETATDEALLDNFDAARSLSGIVERLREVGVDIDPTVGAATIPSGTITDDAFAWMRTELLDRLDPAVDGVCLDLHGSMFVDGEPDPEGAVLGDVRDAVGPDVPVVAALDMHATITDRMVECLDGVAGYRTAPHTDVVETGERAADLLLGVLDGGIDLALGWERVPMLLAGEQSETEAEPMATLIERLRRADDRDGVLDANYFLGFPWADSPHAGCHALVTGRASEESTLAEATNDLARAFWDRRRAFDFTTDAYPPEGALDLAASETDRPVVIAETGDIPGAGASEDLTGFFEALLAREAVGQPVLGIVADAASYRACDDAGEGMSVDLELGRRIDADGPLSVSGTVRTLHASEGTRTARVEVGDAEVIVADERTNLHRDPDFFAALGIDPTTRDVIGEARKDDVLIESGEWWLAVDYSDFNGGTPRAEPGTDSPGEITVDVSVRIFETGF
jgi:microcystin degradation protein MlrC